jgi:D-3-phosphoglycerate dehydrogenase
MGAEAAGRPRVLLADEIDPAAAERLGRSAELVRPGSDGIEAAIADVDAVIVRTSPLPRATLEAAGRLRVIAKHGVGVDAIDVAYAGERGIVVANVPGANAPAVAEFTVLSILSLLKPIAAGRGGAEVGGRTVAVIGWGDIGRRVGAALGALDARVQVFDPAVDEETILAAGAESVGSLAALLPAAEVLTLHLPLTARTRGLIGGAELAAMPAGAFLVNTARGGIVDEEALAAAVASGQIAGAAVDVFVTEPPPADHPLLALDQVVCTPHLAGSTAESLRRMAQGAVDAVLAVLAGERPAHVVETAAAR